MTATIADLLAQLESPGTFATRVRAPADELEISVAGVGRLSFPITPRTAQKLREVARPSPFGLREKTLHDPSVRNTWEISARRVKIAARHWKPVLAKHLHTLQVELGFPEGCTLTEVFDKLLVYEDGQFFKPHQDSEKSDGMVATLVVVLPSEYSGGTLTVEHRGEKKSFRRVENQASDLSLLAFYADCSHEVSPIKSGVRVALTYQLRVEDRSKYPLTKAPVEVVDRLTDAVRAHFEVPFVKRYERSEPAPAERLVYLLDHEYTQRSLAWDNLKNGDRVRIAALLTVAERLDCEVLLALAEVHETWMCEDDYPRGRYGQRGWRFDDDDDDDDDDETDETEEYELVELQDDEIELNHWLDVDGKPVEGIPGTVSGEELHFTKPSRDMDPFKSEHEGYQGNYGNTVDRWYHRAALVMWPRANTFALRAQASPQWAVDELLALRRANTTELESKIATLLPRWKQTAGRVDGARFFAKLTKLATRIDDAALAREWLSPLGMHRLQSQAVRRDLAALVDRHGLPWAQELCADWTKNHHWETPAWAPLLESLCEALCASKSARCEELANWLLKREAKVARERCLDALKENQPWLDLEAFADESAHLAHVFAGAVAVSAHGVLEDTSSFLLDQKQSLPTSFFVQLLQACILRSKALRAHITGSPLHRVCVERLDAVLRAPARDESDWTLEPPLRCACADCKVLAQFLQSARTDHDWPLNKDRRQHIHRAIDSAKLPVLHTTLRQGSPQVLQLRKAPSLFTRERAYRERVKQIRSALPALRPR